MQTVRICKRIRDSAVCWPMERTGGRDNREKSDYGGRYVSVIARLSLGGAVGVNARMHIQNGAPHILMLTY